MSKAKQTKASPTDGTRRRKKGRKSGLSGFGAAVTKVTSAVPTLVSRPAGILIGIIGARFVGSMVDNVLKVSEDKTVGFSAKRLANPASQLAVAAGLYLTRKHTGEMGEFAAYGAGISGASKLIVTYVPSANKLLGLGEPEFDGINGASEATMTEEDRQAAARVLAAHGSQFQPSLEERKEINGGEGENMDGLGDNQYNLNVAPPLWQLTAEMENAEKFDNAEIL